LDLQKPPPSLLSSRSARHREGGSGESALAAAAAAAALAATAGSSTERPEFYSPGDSLDSVHQDISRGHSEEYMADEEALSPMHFVARSSSGRSSSNPSDFVPMSPHSIDDMRLSDPPSLSALTGARPRDTVMSTLSTHADEILGRAERVAREIMQGGRQRLVSTSTDLDSPSIASGVFSSGSSAPPSPITGAIPEHTIDVRHSMSALGGSRLSAFEPASQSRPDSEYLGEADEEDEEEDGGEYGEHDEHDEHDDEEGGESEQTEFLRPRGLPPRPSRSPLSPYSPLPHTSGATPPPPLSAIGSAFPAPGSQRSRGSD